MLFGDVGGGFDPMGNQGPQLVNSKSKNRGYFGGQEFELDKQGRIKYDALGNLLPKNKRRSFLALMDNPYGIKTGNVFDPNFAFSNLPPTGTSGLGKYFPQAGGLFDFGG